MTRILILFSSFCMFACVDNSNKNQAIDLGVEKEIRDRIIKIKFFAQQNDTVFIDPEKVEQKVNELILLSKDIENLNASVNLANQYFNDLAKTFQINTSDFEKLNAGMHVNDIGTALKQNEMIFFNHILLKTSSDAVPMHAVR